MNLHLELLLLSLKDGQALVTDRVGVGKGPGKQQILTQSQETIVPLTQPCLKLEMAFCRN